MPKSINTILKTLIVTTICVGFIAAVAFPNPLKEEDYLYIDIANSRVFSHKYGLALYEKSTRQFHNVSPFDMYYVDSPTSVFEKFVNQSSESKERSSVFSWSDNLIAEESNYNNLAKKLYRMASYFGLSNPTATFEKDGQIAKIKVSKPETNKLSFYLDFSKLKNVSEIEMSFSLNDEDILIDDKNNIYLPTNSSKIEDYLQMQHKVGYNLKTYEDLPYTLDTTFFIITNTNMTGYYKINFENGLVHTNLPAKKLNFIVDNKNPSFIVETGEYLAESLNTNVQF